IELDALLVNQKHRNARTVFAVEEDLLRLVVLWLKAWNVHFVENRRLLCSNVVFVNSYREVERGEVVEHVFVVVQTAKPTSSAKSRQTDFVLEFSSQTKDIGSGCDILTPRCKQFSTGCTNALKWFTTFGQYVFPVVLVRVLRIYQHNATVRCFAIGSYKKHLAHIVDKTKTVVAYIGNDW